MKLVPTLAALAVTSSLVLAGGPTPPERQKVLAGTCKGGANKGAACAFAEECDSNVCDITLARGTLNAVVTVIVDDDVSRYDGSEEYSDVVAVTLLVEVKKSGQTHLLAQTYQDLGGADLNALLIGLRQGPLIADGFFNTTESVMNDIATTVDMLPRFVYQSGDAALVAGLKAIAGAPGQPVIIGVPRKIEQTVLDNHGGDALASVFRLKVKIGFTP